MTLSLFGVALGCVTGGPTTSLDTDTGSDGGGESTGARAGSAADDEPMPPQGDDDSAGTSGGGMADGTSTDGDGGSDGSGSEGDESTTSSGTTGEPPECPGVMVCTPAAPEGWTGPFQLNESESAPAACEGFFSEPVFQGGSSVVADAPSCECGCEVTSASCNDVGALQYFGAANCAVGESQWFMLDPTSTVGEPVPANMRASAWTGAGGGSDQSTCQAELEAASFPAPEFETSAVACEWAGTGESCDGGTCMPAVDGGDLCIVQEGDVECPAGPFQERRVYHQDIDDDRACGCQCESDAGCSTGFAMLTIMPFAGGAQASTVIPANDTCVTPAIPGTALSATYIPGAPAPTCEAEADFTGGVEGVQPFTACCM